MGNLVGGFPKQTARIKTIMLENLSFSACCLPLQRRNVLTI